MIESNKVGHSFPGGLVSKPNARSAETDVNAWRRGIIKAKKAKLKPKYAGIHLLVFAQHCRLQTIDFPFEQVVEPAIERGQDGMRAPFRWSLCVRRSAARYL
jgi:hypothetical protein